MGGACNTNGASPAPGSGNYSTIWQWLVWLNSGSGTSAPGCGVSPYPPCTYTEFNTSCSAGCTVLTCSCTQSSYYWSATTYTPYPPNAWVVYFFNGYEFADGKYSNGYVRAVRGGS